MKVDSYFIVPIELHPQEVANVRDRISSESWGESTLPGTDEHDAFLVKTRAANQSEPHTDLHLAIVDTCLCFVYHQSSSHSPPWKNATGDWVARALETKERIRDQLRPKICGQIGEALAVLNVTESASRASAYALALYVLTLDDPASDPSRVALLLGNISRILKAPTRASGDDSGLFPSKHPVIQNVDSSETSAVYASYSAVVGVAWEDNSRAIGEASDELRAMLLRHQIRLQAAWNRAHQASKDIASQLRRSEARTKRHRRQELNNEEFLRFVQINQLTRQAITPEGSARDRFIFDELVKTSRIQDELDALAIGIDALDKAFDRWNERRLESGQRWIAGLFALFAGTSAAQGITSSFDWSTKCDILVSVGVGLVALGVAWWFTRPGRKVRRPPRGVRDPGPMR